jgi:hypothetical protein
METKTENDQQPKAAESQSSAAVEDMLNALDDLMEAAKRVAVKKTTDDPNADNAHAPGDTSIDSD